MPYRKFYSNLSERQKRRRVADELSDSESDDDISHNYTSDLSINDKSFDRMRSKDYTIMECAISDDVPADHITAEFQKLILDCEEDCSDYLVSDSEESDSDVDDHRITKESDIKNRLRSFFTESNLPDVHGTSLLKILRDAGLTYLPKDIRTLRKTPRHTSIVNCAPGEYYHYGLETALENTLKQINYNSQEIVLDVNIDGLPICKSPPMNLWPILGKIVGDTSKTVFVIGLYKGKEKPHSISTFLDPFIDEYIKLNENGFIYNGRLYTIALRCLICDSPAASYVLNTKQFNGYYGCRKCTVKGEWKGRMVFLNLNETLRTNQMFRERIQQSHHHGLSPFERITNFNMVKQVPLDYMHLLCLGVTKLLIRLWICPRVKPNLNVVHLNNISTALVALSPWVPKEFNRKPQTLLELKTWKATSFRFFLLYAGPIILQKILPEEYMKHFNALNCASRILCSPTLCADPEMLNYAKELLKYFVSEFMVIYDEKYITWNMHNLIHIADDVETYGPMDNFSAFPYENHMQSIKRMLRKKNQQLQQIHHRLVERSYLNQNSKANKTNYPIMSQPVNKNLPVHCYSSHKTLKFKNFVLQDRRPNNCYISKNNEIIVIDSICKNNDKDVIIGRQFLDKQNIENYPLESTLLNICEVKNISKQQMYPANNVKTKAFLLHHDSKSYVMPLLHH